MQILKTCRQFPFEARFLLLNPSKCNCVLRRAENGTYRKLKTGRFSKMPLSVAHIPTAVFRRWGFEKCKFIFKRQETTVLTARPQGFSEKALRALSVTVHSAFVFVQKNFQKLSFYA